MSRLLLFLCFFSAVFCEPEEEPYTPVPTQPKAALNLTECDVCQILAEEMFRQVLMTSETHMEQIGFRLDDQKKVPYARTEYRLLQIVEGLCDQDLFLEPHTPLDDYMFPPPRTGADKDRNIEDVPRLALLKRKCVKWVDDHHEHAIASFNKNEKPYKMKLCVDRLKQCEVPHGPSDFGNHMENQKVKATEKEL